MEEKIITEIKNAIRSWVAQGGNILQGHFEYGNGCCPLGAVIKGKAPHYPHPAYRAAIVLKVRRQWVSGFVDAFDETPGPPYTAEDHREELKAYHAGYEAGTEILTWCREMGYLKK